MLQSVLPKNSALSWFSKIFVVLFVSSFVVSCMRPPKFPRRVSVADVVNNVRCELYTAVREYYDRVSYAGSGWAPTNLGSLKDSYGSIPSHFTAKGEEKAHWLQEWGVGFDLSLVVAREIDASTDITRVVPVTHGTFTHRLKAGLDRDAKSTYVVDFKILNLRNWEKYNCSLQAPYEKRRRLLSGELGLKRWLDQVLIEIETANLENVTKDDDKPRTERRKYEGEVTDLTHTIEFGVGINGNILPSWSLSYGNGTSLMPKFDFGRKRLVTHKLITTMTRIDVVPLDKTWVVYTAADGTQSLVSRRVCIRKSGSIADCPDIDLTKVVSEAKQKLKTAKREFEASEKMKILEDPTKRSLTNEDVKNEILQAMESDPKVREARTRVKDAERMTEEMEDSRKVNEAIARRETERRTERQLDQGITNAIIRDAFRGVR